MAYGITSESQLIDIYTIMDGINKYEAQLVRQNQYNELVEYQRQQALLQQQQQQQQGQTNP